MITIKATCMVLKLKLRSLFATVREIVESSSDSSIFAALRPKDAELVMVFKRVESGCAAVMLV